MHVNTKDGGPAGSCIEVAVPLPLHQTFTYKVPEPLLDAVRPGMRVRIPFGRRRLDGYVLGPCEACNDREIKAVLDLPDPNPVFPEEMVPFFKWVADYYLHPVGEVITCALPPTLTGCDAAVFSITESGQEALASGSQAPEIQRFLECLQNGPATRNTLKGRLKDAFQEAILQHLQNHRWILKTRVLSNPYGGAKYERYAAPAGCNKNGLPLSRKKQDILDALHDLGDTPVRTLNRTFPGAARLLSSLEKQGMIRLFTRPVYRDPFGEPVAPDTPPILTGDQNKAAHTVLSALGRGYHAFLLAGVTGSGKTEVYLHLAAHCLQRGKSALVLVPEIALISQMEKRFRARFGDRVAILHSGLSKGERHDQWIRILKGEVRLVIGARSAVFAPLTHIGVLVVDEEHDPAYKQEKDLRYQARDLAVLRARLGDTVALLGSATPSIQSHYNVRTRKFIGLELPSRIEARPLPEVTVVDLKETEHRRGARRFLTDTLVGAMRETLEKGEQTLLFLNRRGFAGFPVCARCGKPVTCRHCDISMTYHKADHVHACHYCGDSRPADTPCRLCGSERIKNLGLGTEKLEAAIKALFPKASVARMDRDTTRKKGAILNLLKGLKTGAVQILVGTQIVAKGHDYPHITLVGIICADLSLSFPDFRASERTFQILAQVSGRAGRGDRPGRVILQTFNPNHFSITSARDQNFKSFYDQEIRFRKSLHYPPYTHMVALKVSGRNREAVRKWAQALGVAFREAEKGIRTPEATEVLGPIEAPLSKIAGRFRWQILLKSRRIGTLNRRISELFLKGDCLKPPRDIHVAIDVDPYDLM